MRRRRPASTSDTERASRSAERPAIAAEMKRTAKKSAAKPKTSKLADLMEARKSKIVDSGGDVPEVGDFLRMPIFSGPNFMGDVQIEVMRILEDEITPEYNGSLAYWVKGRLLASSCDDLAKYLRTALDKDGARIHLCARSKCEVCYNTDNKREVFHVYNYELELAEAVADDQPRSSKAMPRAKETAPALSGLEVLRQKLDAKKVFPRLFKHSFPWRLPHKKRTLKVRRPHGWPCIRKRHNFIFDFHAMLPRDFNQLKWKKSCRKLSLKNRCLSTFIHRVTPHSKTRGDDDEGFAQSGVFTTSNGGRFSTTQPAP
jgi:hypothetical protein